MLPTDNDHSLILAIPDIIKRSFVRSRSEKQVGEKRM